MTACGIFAYVCLCVRAVYIVMSYHNLDLSVVTWGNHGYVRDILKGNSTAGILVDTSNKIK